ncbi:MAG TPA: DUF2071 domain-containing protein [Tepidisphaeraceae bacterium]|jgi:hypothetical protein|nr:DUF2071 domain-containing protein [Tepidisphaeraceae bacterium]
MNRNRAMFLADWKDALFIHLQIDPQFLGRVVPFELDLRDGHAFVSLVAFTQSHLRPTIGGKLAAWLSAPLAEHEFLNLRAYVRVNGEPAIYFISEWIPNRLATLIGPRLYGLPYHMASLRYRNIPDGNPMQGRIFAPGGSLAYRATIDPRAALASAKPGTLDHFLLERYTAYTHRNGVSRKFNVDHAPWLQTRASAELTEASLLSSNGGWSKSAQIVGANYSPGVKDVAIGRPEICCPKTVAATPASPL